MAVKTAGQFKRAFLVKEGTSVGELATLAGLVGGLGGGLMGAAQEDPDELKFDDKGNVVGYRTSIRQRIKNMVGAAIPSALMSGVGTAILNSSLRRG